MITAPPVIMVTPSTLVDLAGHVSAMGTLTLRTQRHVTLEPDSASSVCITQMETLAQSVNWVIMEMLLFRTVGVSTVILKQQRFFK